MQKLYEFNRVNSLDVFDDVAANISIVPTIDRIIFNFEYVLETTGLSDIYNDTIKYLEQCQHLQNAHKHSETISKLCANTGYTDVFQISDNETRKRVLQFSRQGYAEFCRCVQRCIDNKTIGIISPPKKPVCKHDYNTLIAFSIANMKANILDPTRKYKDDEKNNIRLNYITKAFEEKQRYLEHVEYNQDRTEFLNSCSFKFKYASKEYNKSIERTKDSIISATKHVTNSNDHRMICDILDYITKLQTYIARWRVIQVIHRNDPDSRKYVKMHYDRMDYFKNHQLNLLSQSYKSVVDDITNMFSNVSLPHYDDPKLEQKRENIYRLASTCHELESTFSEHINNIDSHLPLQRDFLAGKFDILSLYVEDVSTKHQLTILEQFLKQHPIPIKPKSSLIIPSSTNNQSSNSDLQHQLEEERTKNQQTIADLQRQLEEERTKVQEANALADTYRQNMITLHNSLDEERAENQALRKQLADIQEFLSQWAALTSQ